MKASLKLLKLLLNSTIALLPIVVSGWRNIDCSPPIRIMAKRFTGQTSENINYSTIQILILLMRLILLFGQIFRNSITALLTY